jgi:hypothetical protein
MGEWRKSSHSDGNGGSCVEVGEASGVVLVRDTTNRAGFILSVPASAWAALLATLRLQPPMCELSSGGVPHRPRAVVSCCVWLHAVGPVLALVVCAITWF